MVRNTYKVIVILFLIFIIENNLIVSNKYSLKSNNRGELKIVQISDYHNKKFTNKRLIRKINFHKPDIIVITGDLVDSRRTDLELSMNLLESLSKNYPVYYVLGNHEGRISEIKNFLAKLNNMGIHILEDEYTTLDENFIIVGISDPSIKGEKHLKSSLKVNMKEIKLKYKEDKYLIGLSHRPELFDIYVDSKLDLVLTGHTHGGQIRIPFIGGIIAPNQGFNPSYINGLYEGEKTKMIVNKGLGNSLIPFRLFNPGEIVIIDIKN